MASRLLTLAASFALLSLLVPTALSARPRPGPAKPGKTVTFHIEQGSNNIYFAVAIKFTDPVNSVELMETNSPYPGATGWERLTHSWSNIWRLDPNHPTLPPFSIRINNRYVAKNVIPPNWKPNTIYTATLA